ncbi:hypothetical protein RJ640_010925 [Escallonia rubra]|uniref:Uncharacterized protein n=1 Tax=Escallonia rubra TaxID=112253 RepID=A0AA88UIY5_9ASTE|nr:hypothetical protein RJ640_010925 [Escallonia rubra]
MGTDLITTPRRSSYFSVSGCMSPSCVSVHEDYSRIRARGGDSGSRKWRKMLKKLAAESKSIYGSKPMTFHYDAVSYAQNFDEGHHGDEYAHRLQVFRQYRWHVQKQ